MNNLAPCEGVQLLPGDSKEQLLSRFSRVRLCATPQMAAHQAPPSLGFSRQESSICMLLLYSFIRVAHKIIWEGDVG